MAAERSFRGPGSVAPISRAATPSRPQDSCIAAKSWLLADALNALSESLSRPMTAVNFDCHFWSSDARAFMETVGLVETSTTPAWTGCPDAVSDDGWASTPPAAMAAAPTAKTAEYQTRSDVDMIPLTDVDPRRMFIQAKGYANTGTSPTRPTSAPVRRCAGAPPAVMPWSRAWQGRRVRPRHDADDVPIIVSDAIPATEPHPSGDGTR